MPSLPAPIAASGRYRSQRAQASQCQPASLRMRLRSSSIESALSSGASRVATGSIWPRGIGTSEASDAAGAQSATPRADTDGLAAWYVSEIATARSARSNSPAEHASTSTARSRGHLARTPRRSGIRCARKCGRFAEECGSLCIPCTRGTPVPLPGQATQRAPSTKDHRQHLFLQPCGVGFVEKPRNPHLV